MKKEAVTQTRATATKPTNKLSQLYCGSITYRAIYWHRTRSNPHSDSANKRKYIKPQGRKPYKNS